MSKLAEWVMAKQRNAIIAIAALSMLPMLFVLAGVIQALVVLRKGVAESIPVLAFGGLPSLVIWLAWGDVTVFLILAQIAVLSYVLRTTISWSKTLMAAVSVAVLSVFLLPLLMGDYLLLLVKAVQIYLAKFEPLEMQQVLGLLGLKEASSDSLFRYLVVSTSVAHMVVALVAVFWGRLLQSRLYNPGGLQKEMWQLRLPVIAILLIVGMRVLGYNLGESFHFLAAIAAPIIVIAGTALIHGVCAKIQNGKIWLITFYIVGLIMFGAYIVNILMLLLVIDNVIDIRGRIANNKSDLNES